MRILKRPMFKKGGSANEGIMDGLVDRRGYAHGSPYKHYEKFQSLGEPVNLRTEFKEDYGIGPGVGSLDIMAGQHGFAVASKEQRDRAEWWKNVATPADKETEFALWKKDEGKEHVEALAEHKKIKKEYEATQATKGYPGATKYEPPIKPNGDIDNLTANRLKNLNLVAEKQDGLSEKAKRYREILSPHAVKRATYDALAAASAAGATSTGNTMQDIANMISAAAQASGGAGDVIDKANLLALQEEIQTNIAKATYKPNATDSLIQFYKDAGWSTDKIAALLSKSDTDNAMTMEFVKQFPDDANQLGRATGMTYEMKARSANKEKEYGGTIPFKMVKNERKAAFEKMIVGKTYFNALDGVFYKIEKGEKEPKAVGKPDYL